MVKVLFVCMGNICRSPAAEGVMKSLIQKYNLTDKLYCESAGTSAYHVGDLPDERMRKHAQIRDLTLDSPAQLFTREHFEIFDYVVTINSTSSKTYSDLTLKTCLPRRLSPWHTSVIRSVLTRYLTPTMAATRVLNLS